MPGHYTVGQKWRVTQWLTINPLDSASARLGRVEAGYPRFSLKQTDLLEPRIYGIAGHLTSAHSAHAIRRGPEAVVCSCKDSYLLFRHLHIIQVQ